MNQTALTSRLSPFALLLPLRSSLNHVKVSPIHLRGSVIRSSSTLGSFPMIFSERRAPAARGAAEDGGTVSVPAVHHHSGAQTAMTRRGQRSRLIRSHGGRLMGCGTRTTPAGALIATIAPSYAWSIGVHRRHSADYDGRQVPTVSRQSGKTIVQQLRCLLKVGHTVQRRKFHSSFSFISSSYSPRTRRST